MSWKDKPSIMFYVPSNNNCRNHTLALIGDPRRSTPAVLVLALVLRRARYPVEDGGRFGVKQAKKCERGVEMR